MWRAVNVIRSHQRLSRSLSRRGLFPSSQCRRPCDVSANLTVRPFSKKQFGLEDESGGMDIDGLPGMSGAPERNFSAADMEFFNNMNFDDYADDDDDDEVDAERMEEEAYRRRQEEIQRELDTRTGRTWTDPWEITEEDWMATTKPDDIPDWSPEFVSRISQERVKVHPDGIPTLSTLAKLPLPPPACPHPGLPDQAKYYEAVLDGHHYTYISRKVSTLAAPRLAKIFDLKDWQDKQDAVDELFETVEIELKEQEEVLGLHPKFGYWVESALEEHLENIQQKAELEAGKGDSVGAKIKESQTPVDDTDAYPVFMDCYSPDEPDTMVPSILTPLKPHPNDGPGRMVEEWELSAHSATKRILLRQPTRLIAQTLEENDVSRIYVHGRKGVGKTAVLASVVASARRSGHIVLYLPDGDRLRKLGFFITPNRQREGIYDLQDLSQEVCGQLLDNHKDDMEGMEADRQTLERFFKDTQLERIDGYAGDKMSLLELLNYGLQKKLHAPMCYAVVVDRLMNQEEKPFLIVLDEANCYFDSGHYYHMAYDEEVRKAIPYEQISLFEPALNAIALTTSDDEDDDRTPQLMKRGGIIFSVTESRAVRRKVTDGLTAYAQRQSTKKGASGARLHVVEVPRFSDLEADHIIANFEATGVGKLRLDRGDTVIDDQEVAYLKTISGNVGQKLLDVAII